MQLCAPSLNIFNILNECMEYAIVFIKNQEFAIMTKWSKYTYINNVKQLQIQYLKCSKGKTYKDPLDRHEDDCDKDSISSLIDYPFAASIQWQNYENTYLFFMDNSQHNHEPTLPIALTQHCILTNDSKEFISQMSAAGAFLRQITSALYLADSEILLMVQDIYNEHKLICLEKLAGWSPIEALFYELQQGDFFIRHKTHITGNVTHLFFTSPASVEL